ncbi:hypothetical protein [Pontibacter pamirensis]|uniref:hypothetical protein n=1 Tax=Pontibacter pamirensis TaxID=2562824 RepID=UPI001389E1CB|nr:hypothetical protein [Pontibacter pamirensis]
MVPQTFITANETYHQSKLRLYTGMLKLCNQELNLLQEELAEGHIEQRCYDSAVAAIDHDRQHLQVSIAALSVTNVPWRGQQYLGNFN